MGLLSFLKREKVDYASLISNGAKIIDVRTKDEFRSGHVKGSVNMPLQNIKNWAKKLDRNKPIILICQSGTRAGFAKRTLRSSGFEAHNGGSWRNIDKLTR